MEASKKSSGPEVTANAETRGYWITDADVGAAATCELLDRANESGSRALRRRVSRSTRRIRQAANEKYFATMARGHVALAGAGVLAAYNNVKPNNSIPGGKAFERVAGGVMQLALVACVVAAMIGAGKWAFGNRGGNAHHSSEGKTMCLTAIAAAFVIGGVTKLIGFGFDLGQGI